MSSSERVHSGSSRSSAETLSRWETGAQIQQRGFDLLLRLYFALPAVREYLAPEESPEPVSASTAETILIVGRRTEREYIYAPMGNCNGALALTGGG